MARPPDRRPPPVPHDAAYKAMYRHRQAILDLRRYLAAPHGPLGPGTLAALDFSTLAKLPAEWVTEGFRRRHGDQVWRIRFRDAAPESGIGAGAWLLLLLEFQSRDDPDMALRILGYVVELYRDLEAQGVVRPGLRRPPVLPVVVHNGGVAVARTGGGGGADSVAGAACVGTAGPRDVAALSTAARG